MALAIPFGISDSLRSGFDSAGWADSNGFSLALADRRMESAITFRRAKGFGMMVDRTSVLTADEEMGWPAHARQFLKEARERLDQVANLPDDWDSYGAASPTSDAVAAAHALLTAHWTRQADQIDQNAVPWAVAPLADGGVQFEWRAGDAAIEVEVAPDGTLNYLVERAERTIRRSDPNRGASESEVLEQVQAVLDSGLEP